MNENEQLLKEGKSMKIRNIIGIVLVFTLIGMIASFVISLIDSIKILTKSYKDQKLEEEKLLWGILSLLILGNIGCLVFACKMIATAKKDIGTLETEVIEEKK